MSDENINPNETPEPVIPETPLEEAAVETPSEEVLAEVAAESETSEESVSDASSSEEAPAPEAPKAGPKAPAFGTPLSARGAAPSRGGNGGGRRDDRGGSSSGGGRRDDRRGGKGSGFEQVKKEFEEVLLEVGRVTKVTSGGRQLRFRAAVVIGDRKGRVGFGLGKAQEVSIAVEKAVNSAKRHLVKVPLINGTIPHQVDTKFKSVKIMIHPASEGTGIIAGGSTRRILDLAGCQNILSKRHGGRNVITTAYATMEALKKLQDKAA